MFQPADRGLRLSQPVAFFGQESDTRLQLVHQSGHSRGFFASSIDGFLLSLETSPALHHLFSELLQRSETVFGGGAQVTHDLERFDPLLDGVEHIDGQLAAFLCQTADVA